MSSKFCTSAAGVCLALGLAAAAAVPAFADTPVPSSELPSWEASSKGAKKYNPVRQSKEERNKKAVKSCPEGYSSLAVTDMRLVSLWFADAYGIPARVPEELFLAGYSYSDAVAAFSLMDAGASLNEILELRRTNRWDAVAGKLGINIDSLPEAVVKVMNAQTGGTAPEYVHFLPDVHSGLAEELELPSFSPAVPDQVAISTFKLSPDDIANIRAAMENPNNLDAETLRRPAGRSLKVGDWLIAGVLAKYKPFSMNTILSTRIGEVVEWGDVAYVFSVDPKIFSEGLLAPIYGAMIDGENYATISSLRRSSYPKYISGSYELSSLKGDELRAVGWLMSLYYKETPAEREILNRSGLNFEDQVLALAIARLAFADVDDIAVRMSCGTGCQYLLESYHVDMTGQDIIRDAVMERDKSRNIKVYRQESASSSADRKEKKHSYSQHRI